MSPRALLLAAIVLLSTTASFAIGTTLRRRGAAHVRAGRRTRGQTLLRLSVFLLALGALLVLGALATALLGWARMWANPLQGERRKLQKIIDWFRHGGA